ncbi:proline-rich transmembrane protein 1-like [Hypanus sabinus]|uniref:proline-rich transmembrane protein 1-like n=1 Tax=Hypanus sabinus TaxID=79690 RepID=UPI0028C4A035|nr:proline-rich transmembrane protein 1-like [Hypanus sabinus]
MSTEKTGPSDAPVPTSSPPPYSQVIEPRLHALSMTYSVQTQIPAPPVDVRGHMQETAFHSGAPGFTTLLPCGAVGRSSYTAQPPPGYAIQLQPYTTLIPVYPIGNPRQPYLPGYLGIAPNGTQSRIRILNPQRSPHDYLPIAVLTTICCFWPTGIFAIIKALETRAAVSRGDYLSAQISSRQARNYSFISLAVGISAMVLCAILAIVVAIEGKHRDTEWDP